MYQIKSKLDQWRQSVTVVHPGSWVPMGPLVGTISWSRCCHSLWWSYWDGNKTIVSFVRNPTFKLVGLCWNTHQVCFIEQDDPLLHHRQSASWWSCFSNVHNLHHLASQQAAGHFIIWSISDWQWLISMGDCLRTLSRNSSEKKAIWQYRLRYWRWQRSSSLTFKEKSCQSCTNNWLAEVNSN